MIKITFPDGNVKEFEAGVTTFEIAKSISPSLAKKTLACKVNGKLIDATRAINEDSNFEIVTPDHEDALGILRHSAAHLFAQAAKRHLIIHLGCLDQLFKMVSITIQITKPVKFQMMIWQQLKLK